MLNFIDQVVLKNRTIILRADLNVPLKNHNVVSNYRIKMILPTLNHLLKNNNRIIIISHLGRPAGENKKEFSLKPVALELAKLIHRPVIFFDQDITRMPRLKNIISSSEKSLILLENLRFYPGEEANDLEFASQIARMGDVFVQDAFANLHREHASMTQLKKILPSYLGLLVKKEIVNLDLLLDTKQKFSFLLGGAKIKEKLDLANHLAQQTESLLVGGAIANNFLLNQGYKIGKSLYDPLANKSVQKLIKNYQDQGIDLSFPKDVIDQNNLTYQVKKNNFNPSEKIIDIGQESCLSFLKILKSSQLIFWNGTLGMTEHLHGSTSSKQILASLIKLVADQKCKVIVGGGDTAGFCQQHHAINRLTWVSTGGGATISYLLKGGKLSNLQ